MVDASDREEEMSEDKIRGKFVYSLDL